MTYICYGKLGAALSNFLLSKDLSVIEIRERANAELGVTWIGGISSRTGVPADYGVLASEWRSIVPARR
jgi:hypothetical protein